MSTSAVVACPECKVGQMRGGRLYDYSLYGLRFKPFDKPWWKRSRRVGAAACDRCGFIVLNLTRD